MSVWSEMTVSDFSGIYNVPSVRGRYVHIMERPTWGLCFCRDGGQITYHHKGNTFVSNRNCALLLPMGGDYELTGEADGEFPLINFLCSAPPRTDSFIVLPIRDTKEYLRIFDRMYRLWLEDGQANHPRLMSLFYELLSHLADEQREPKPSELLAPAMKLLSRSLFDSELTVAALAAHVNLSEAYFRRLFKQAFGTSPKQYVLELRIRQAKQLLSEHTASVSAVAEYCGFSSVYHFSRAFKAATGQTPSEYMAR